MSRRVLIYRSDLLPPSETFIAAQADALCRYQPVFLGLCRCCPSLPLLHPSIVPGRAASLQRLLALQTGFAPGLLRRARAADAVLLHAHFAVDAAEALPLARRLELPLVVTLHGYDVMRSDAAHAATRRGRRYLARRPQLFEQAAAFVCVSDAIRRAALLRGFPEPKLHVLPIGIDLTLYPEPPVLASAPTVLFVGRLVTKKGCHTLIAAMEQVQRAMPHARLLIAGDGPERPRLEALAGERILGARFLGLQTQEQIRTLFGSARCLAAPSLTSPDGDAEGLPTVLCEALAAGLPVASTVHSGIPELIVHGEHGLLAPENDADMLARHILALCSDDALARRVREAGRRRVAEHFNIAGQTLALEALYDKTIAARQTACAPAPLSRAGKPVTLRPEPTAAFPPATPAFSKKASAQPARLRHQVAWLLSGNSASMLFQALAFILVGRMLGSREYGAFVGAVALVNVLSQFSSLGMEMVLLRTIACDPGAFAVTWFRALVVSGSGFLLLLAAVVLYGHFFLPAPLRSLLPFLACSDALFGKFTQLASRALQGAEHIRWSAKLLACTNAARAAAAALLFFPARAATTPVTLLAWAHLYALASLFVAVLAACVVTHLLGRPRLCAVRRAHLLEGLSFSFSNSAISVYNDIDKTLLVQHGMFYAAGIYAAAYRIVDVASAPIFSLFGAASPGLFRDGAHGGPVAAARGARRLLRWAIPYGVALTCMLALSAPAVPRLFGHSFAGSVQALRFLCLLPLLRGLHYAWGTAITACASQWLRTAAQAGVAVLNLLLNLWLIPRWGWQGAAAASLLSDGSLALACFLVLKTLQSRQFSGRAAPIDGALPQTFAQ